MSSGETTDSFHLPPAGDYYATSWELLMLEGSSAARLPLTRVTTTLGPSQGRHNLERPDAPVVKLSWVENQLLFWVSTSSRDFLVNGNPRRTGVLEIHDELEWAGLRLKVVDRSQTLKATLECFSSPFLARIWPIDGESTCLGRPGRRSNQVELDHPTISREHATIFWRSQGAVIQSDTERSLLAVEGRTLSFGEQADLVDGALLQLGELTFRFRLLREPEPQLRGPRLNVRSLGNFLVCCGQTAISEKSWRTSNVRWLMARLAVDWGRPVPTDLLLELFWPDMTVHNSRNNLNYSLSTLRSALRSEEFPEVDYFLRTRNTLQLHPDLLGEHDLQLVQDALAHARQLSSQSRDALAAGYTQKALQLYQGAYLEGCFQDWALTIRKRLETELMECGRALLQHYSLSQQWSSLLEAGARLLELDPCCQTCCSLCMGAQVARGCPQEAFRLYERILQNLDRELGVGPGPELKAAHSAALTQFGD